MKKKNIIILGIIVVIVIVIIAIIVIRKNNVHKIADIINKNSNLPIKYMSKFDTKDSNLQKFNKLDNYMSKDFTDEDILLSYYGYPNDESEYCLGSIGLLTNKYNILGVTVGDNMKQAITKLEKYGFKLKESDDYLEVTLKNNDFTITMEADLENSIDDKDNIVIEGIEIKADSKYLGNRVY